MSGKALLDTNIVIGLFANDSNALDAIGRIQCDAVTAFFYGDVKDKLRQIGKPIPENDIWIAAIAVQYDLTLITQDEHFKEVPGLARETW